jgi:CheY-like chemotaxis protein
MTNRTSGSCSGGSSNAPGMKWAMPGMALLAVQEFAPNLVVTDVMMPVMNGVELIRRLREDPATAHIPVVAASGDTHLAEAADAVVPKPYECRRLVAVVDALLKEECGRS